LTVEPGRAAVQLFDRDRLKDIPILAAKFSQTVSKILEVPEFTRIGLREIYERVYPTKEDAVAEFLKFGFLKIPEGKHFGVAGVLINPETNFRKEEGGKGYSVRIKTESTEYKLELPSLWRKVAKSILEIREKLFVDIDCFAQGTILSSQISFEDWITQTLHVIRRDTDAFLGG
jgi:hypothetical protein